MSFITTKFHEILLSGFRGVAGLTDRLTNRQVKNIIPSATRCGDKNGYNYIGYVYESVTALNWFMTYQSVAALDTSILERSMVTTPMTLTLEEKKLVSFLIVSSRSRSAISSCFRENSNLQTDKTLHINNKNIAHQPQNHCTSTTKPLNINPQNHRTSNTKPLHINSQNHRTSNTKTFAYQPQ